MSMTPRRLHSSAAMALAAVMLLIGVALAVEAVASGAVMSPRLLLGALFVVAGVGRLYIEVRRGPRA
jgi:hypothetical protein